MLDTLTTIQIKFDGKTHKSLKAALNSQRDSSLWEKKASTDDVPANEIPKSIYHLHHNARESILNFICFHTSVVD